MPFEQKNNIPPGLKPRFYAALAAWLKPCPFKASARLNESKCPAEQKQVPG